MKRSRHYRLISPIFRVTSARERLESTEHRLVSHTIPISHSDEMTGDSAAHKSAEFAGQPEITGVYVISVAARLLEMHPQTLRKYERMGFITPSRTMGMLRLYSEEDLARLRMIKFLVEDRGMNLAGVEMILNLVIGVLGVQKLVGELLGTSAGSKTLLQEQLKRIIDMVRFPD